NQNERILLSLVCGQAWAHHAHGSSESDGNVVPAREIHQAHRSDRKVQHQFYIRRSELLELSYLYSKWSGFGLPRDRRRAALQSNLVCRRAGWTYVQLQMRCASRRRKNRLALGCDEDSRVPVLSACLEDLQI